ncbi:BppU family phage baseplate upper protein [Dorea formicigenerans]|uniref:BppU family phage baseplate upper protein n=1 Tax=Dorea formicigenerans TaxID=39486 RepID=UPI00321901D6
MADITITQKITIELDGKSPFEYVVMKQGDKGSRILAVSLLQNKQPYEIPTGCTARIKYYKPDGNPVLNDCTLSGDEILVTYTEQMLAAAGVGKGEIVLLKNGKELKSATYYTKIVETVYKTEGLTSDKEFLSVATVLNDMDQAAQKATAEAKIAEAAAATATEKAQAAGTAAGKATTAAGAADRAKANADAATKAANEAKTNAEKATQSANTAAGDAQKATTAAKAAAAACEGIAAGINTIADTTTGKTYTIGVDAGRIYLEARD